MRVINFTKTHPRKIGAGRNTNKNLKSRVPIKELFRWFLNLSLINRRDMGSIEQPIDGLDGEVANATQNLLAQATSKPCPVSLQF